jgi:hypothetical protein
MKTKIKQKWVKALRSGEYSQGKFKLYDGINYCCLGVLCQLYLKEIDGTWDILDKPSWDGISDKYHINGESELLPGAVMDWAELNSGNGDPLVNLDLDANSLAGLNDSLNYTFSEIADLIEAQL